MLLVVPSHVISCAAPSLLSANFDTSTFPGSKDLILVKYDQDKLHFVPTANTTNHLQRARSANNGYSFLLLSQNSTATLITVSCKVLHQWETLFEIRIFHRNGSDTQGQKADSFPFHPAWPAPHWPNSDHLQVFDKVTCQAPRELLFLTISWALSSLAEPWGPPGAALPPEKDCEDNPHHFCCP